MEVVMNAFSHASATPVSGSKLDFRRVLAALLDIALLTAGGVLILAAAGRLDSSGGVGTDLSAVIAGWMLFYYFACESGHGQTVGKRLLQLRVVRADGRPSGMREILVRTALRPIDAVGGYLLGLVVMLITGERRQRLGDLAAGTMVVSAEPPAAPVLPTIEEAVATEAVVEPRPAEEEPAAVEEPAPVVDVEEPAPVVEVEEPAPVVEEPLPAAHEDREPEAGGDATTVRSVETVSAIDLVMGVDVDEPEDDSDGDDPADAQRS
jgi:uncharacterized RDD family membrane protein YckC